MGADRIGRLAGNIVEALARRGPLTLNGLCSICPKESPVAVVMALGWLMREDRVVLANRCLRLVVMLHDPVSPGDADRPEQVGGEAVEAGAERSA